MGTVFLVLLTIVYFILKKILNRVQEDIDEVTLYLKEISENKNYEAVVQIKYYLEFLQMSLLLKNIVKRLKQKDKKTSKK